jgi:hypothetical protein
MTLGTSCGTHWEPGQCNETSFGNIMEIALGIENEHIET